MARHANNRTTAISDIVSKKVRDQYEEHPYPRWRYAPTNLKTHFLSQLNHEIQPNEIKINNKFNKRRFSHSNFAIKKNYISFTYYFRKIFRKIFCIL